MTRLPSDSFLPSGALDHEPALTGAIRSSGNGNNNALASPNNVAPVNGDPTAGFVSPLSLSRAPSQYSYFDIRPPAQDQPQRNISSPMSVSGAIPLYPQNFLSPHLQATTNYDRRSVSLSPTRRARVNGYHTASAVTSPLRHPVMGSALNGLPPSSSSPSLLANAVTSHPRSVSADAASANSPAHLINRLTQQNNRIRETWEAERRYLEANRERVEEVYREERVIMDQERTSWESEKHALEDQVRQLRNLVSNLQTQNSLLSKRLDLQRAGKMAGISVPLASFRGAAPFDGSVDFGFPSSSSVQSLPRTLPGDSSSSNSGSQAISPLQNRMHYISPNVSRMSPARQPDVSPFIPLNQHIQPPTAPASDFLATVKPDPKIPTIDVQELHPELEGIPIRTTAVKKDTFKDGPTPPADSNSASRESSPPGDAGKAKRVVSKEQTLQLLTAPETHRLTMHAGHTPSHSLSHLPTLPGTEVATVAIDSGECTPMQSTAGASSHKNADTEPTAHDAENSQETGGQQGEAIALDTKYALEPEEDTKLKAPLMVRNIPAYDEEFFKLVNEKLEKLSSGTDAVPAVLKNQVDDEGEVTRGREAPACSSAKVRTTDASSDPPVAITRTRSGSDQAQDDDDEPDIPLKMKTTLNFGAPLGEMH